MKRFFALALALLLHANLASAASAAHTPSAPAVTATVNGSSVVLTWAAPTINTDGSTVASAAYTFKSYFVYRGTTAAAAATGTPYAGQTPSPAISALTYTDTSAASLNDYYAVSAWYCDATGCSQSALSSAVQPAPTPAPAPTPVTGTVTLTWVDPTLNMDGSALTDLASINVYRGASCTALSVAATVKAPATTYSDTGLTSGPYCYALTSVSTSEGEGPQSPTIAVTVSNSIPTTKPAAPGAAAAVCVVTAPTGVKVTCTVTP